MNDTDRDLNSHTGPIVLTCGICEDAPALLQLTIADADGTILDSIKVCGSTSCRNQASGALTPGNTDAMRPMLSKGSR